MQNLEMSQSDIFWNRIKSAGIFLLGISAIMSCISLIFVARLALDISEKSERITEVSQCENRLAAEMRASIGIGLAAVAESNEQELQVVANKLRELSAEEC